MFRLGKQISGSERVGLWAAGLYAFFSPTQIFFAQSLWSECFYGGLLLVAFWLFNRLQTLTEKFQNSLKWPFRSGLWSVFVSSLEGCDLHAAHLRGCDAVEPLSSGRDLETGRCIAAGRSPGGHTLQRVHFNKFDHQIISDRTMGQMMWLGNNDFAPVTFDWEMVRCLDTSLNSTPTLVASPVVLVKTPWIERTVRLKWQGVDTKPPRRIYPSHAAGAQLLNPHSFLTRHLRWGYWRGFLKLWMKS